MKSFRWINQICPIRFDRNTFPLNNRRKYSLLYPLISEAVFTVINSGLSGKLDPRLTVRLASGFPEGIGGSGCTCGALTGGILSLGLFLGRSSPGFLNNKSIMRVSKELHYLFKDNFGATCCRVLSKGIKHGSKEQFKKGSLIVGFSSEQTARILLREKPALIKTADGSYLEKMDSTLSSGFKRCVYWFYE